jgi:hypothetical protein
MKKEGKKSLIIIIIVLIVIVLAVSLFIIFAPPKFSEKDILNDPSAAMTLCQETSGDKQSNCYLKIADVLALNNTDMALQACLAINKDTNEGDRKNCVEDLASKQEDQIKATEICNSMKEDTKFREHCYGGVIANTGNLDSDTQLLMCDSKTGTDKDNCYRGLSESFYSSNVPKSVEICNKISEKSTKDGCLNNIIGNPEIVQANPDLAVSICDSLTLKSNCYSYVAQTVSGIDPKKGALICQKLSDDTQMLNCYHNTWFDFKSVVLQNPDFMISLCNTLTVKRDECLRGASEIFMTADKAKAEEICKLASASTVEGCLHVIQSGE